MKLTLTYSEAQDKIAASHSLNYDQVEILGIPAPVPSPDVPDPYRPNMRAGLEILLRVLRENRAPNTWVDKITLIKGVRSITGWGLKEAKDFVEANL